MASRLSESEVYAMIVDDLIVRTNLFCPMIFHFSLRRTRTQRKSKALQHHISLQKCVCSVNRMGKSD